MVKIPEPYKTTLEELGFDAPRQALFLTGVIVGKIGSAQWKDSKNKPILNRINYQGMPLSRIKAFTVDLFEGLKHNKMLEYSESVHSASKALLNKSEMQWPLSDKENVYYILSGYAFETQRIINKNGDENEDEEVI